MTSPKKLFSSLLLSFFILVGLTIHSFAVDVAEFYVTPTATPASYQIEFNIPNEPTIDRTELDLTLTTNSAGYSFRLDPPCGDDTPLTVPSSAGTVESTAIPCGSGNDKNIGVFHDVLNSEYRIRIVHDEVPITSSEDWTLTIGNFPAGTQSHVYISIRSEDTDVTPVAEKPTDFTPNIPNSVFCLNQPSPIDFIRVTAGDQETRSYKIWNKQTCPTGTDGTADLRIKDISLVGVSGPFTITKPTTLPTPTSPLTILEGDFVEIEIEYTPTSPTSTASPHQGTLHIVYEMFNQTLNIMEDRSDSDVTFTGTSVYRDIVLVIDTSGSMSWDDAGNKPPLPSGVKSRLEKARETVTNTFFSLLVPQLEDKGRLGMIEFSGQSGNCSNVGANANRFFSVRTINSTNITGTGPNSATTLLNLLDAEGDTPTGKAIAEASDMILADTSDEMFKVIILLSDGRHWARCNGPGNIYDPFSSTLYTDIINNQVQLFTIAYGSVMLEYQQLEQFKTLAHPPTNPGGGYTVYNDLSASTLNSELKNILKTALDLDGAIDPFGEIRQGEAHKYDVFITEYDDKAFFSLTWDTAGPNRLTLALKTSDGILITPAFAAKHKDIDFVATSNSKGYIIRRSFLQGYKYEGQRIGKWEINITASGLKEGESERYDYDVLLDSDLKMRTKLGKSKYYVGQKILILAEITENGLAVRDATVQVKIERPIDSSGNWHHQHPVTNKQLDEAGIPRTISGELLDGKERKIRYLSKEYMKFAGSYDPSVPIITLYDDGDHGDGQKDDGVYGNFYDDTKIHGHYKFNFSATGRTDEGNRFSREKRITTYVSSLPSYVNSVIDVIYDKDLDGFTYYQVKVTPKDRFGNFLGPGFSEHIHLETTSGEFSVVIDDDLNGTYGQSLRVLSEGATPLVKARVLGVSLPSVRPDYAPGKTRLFSVSVYATAILVLATLVCSITILGFMYYKWYKR